MRGATSKAFCSQQPYHISIHAPHAGRDGIKVNIHIGEVLFQSTRPMRGATLVSQSTAETITISIHAPHAGRDVGDQIMMQTDGISIHAPHAGRDLTTLYTS